MHWRIKPHNMLKSFTFLAVIVFVMTNCNSSTNKPTQENIMTRNKLKELISGYTTALVNRDLDKMMTFWAEDGILRFPYATGMFPDVIEGKDAIYELSKLVPEGYDSISFSDEKMIIEESTNTVVVMQEGSHYLKGGTLYENTYIIVVRYNNEGKIIEFSEYFNPYITAKSYGMLDKLDI